MSRFSGPQSTGKHGRKNTGAMRLHREKKRQEALERQERYEADKKDGHDES